MNGVDVTSVQHDDAVKLLTCGVGQIVLDVRRCCPVSPGVASDASDTSELEIVDLTLPYLNSLSLSDRPGPPQFRLEAFKITGDRQLSSKPASSGDCFAVGGDVEAAPSTQSSLGGDDVAAVPEGKPACPGKQEDPGKKGTSSESAASFKEAPVLKRQASSSTEGSGSFRRGILRRLLPAPEDDRTPSPEEEEDLYENRFLFSSSSQRTGEHDDKYGGGGGGGGGLTSYLASEDVDETRYHVVSRLIQDDIVRTIQPL